jgi:uncharacterized protein (DUF488 family)
MWPDPSPDPANLRIFTIGHGVRPIEELVSVLRDAGVRRLVDVRSAPGSRRNPQFARTALERSLPDVGVEYVWRPDLGGWRKPLPDSPNAALRNAGFRGYADYMRTSEFGAALGWLVETARRSVTAFMCAETLWWRCHRRLIADALVAGGHQVVHLIGPAHSEVHVLSPEARVNEDGLVYDRPAGRSSVFRT